jgi:hypothetical protein
MKHNEKSKNNRLLIAVLAMVLLLGVTPLAHAVPTLTLTDGTTTITIEDGKILDSNPLAGVVTYIGGIGVWSINVSTGISPTTADPFMDLSSANASSGAGNLSILFTETGFTPGSAMSIGGTSTVSAGGSLLYTSWYGADLLGLLSFGLPALPFGGSQDISYYQPLSENIGPLTMQVDISHFGRGTTSFDANIAVPEPSTLLLLGSGLTGLAFLSRRKYQSS